MGQIITTEITENTERVFMVHCLQWSVNASYLSPLCSL